MQRPPEVLCPVLQIWQVLNPVGLSRLQLQARSGEQEQYPEKAESRRPQHLQSLHLTLPIQRQVAQRNLYQKADRIHCSIYSLKKEILKEVVP